MSNNKVLLAGLVGAVIAFLLGFIVYGNVLTDFFVENSGSASGVMRGDDEMQWVPMILGHITWGLLFAIIYGRWANISTFTSGAKTGALLGFLIGASFDLIQLGSTHIPNLTGVIVDIIVMTIISAIVGGVVGWFLGRKKEA
ncbi:hypothetical protein [Pontimicrobium aquaticum]|uniref:Uncharacterized protein n=1 Tax=Pontimicrobium aquaticum TaxID=2565367 RepID=A0A4U0F0L4_9FLAO|nr:hypothetical protein [Pontimicrobium aquaticum]TJY37927.1 hypothetical protein E5167_01335 [Pontimicrobium aquaticum]